MIYKRARERERERRREISFNVKKLSAAVKLPAEIN